MLKVYLYYVMRINYNLNKNMYVIAFKF